MKIKFLLILSILIFSNCKKSDKKAVSKHIDKVQMSMDKNADSLLLDSKINAVSIGVYKDGKKYTSHYGELDKGKGNTPSDNTIYEIASVSKTFTGVLVANAVLEGKLALEDDIRKYLKKISKILNIMANLLGLNIYQRIPVECQNSCLKVLIRCSMTLMKIYLLRCLKFKKIMVKKNFFVICIQ